MPAITRQNSWSLRPSEDAIHSRDRGDDLNTRHCVAWPVVTSYSWTAASGNSADAGKRFITHGPVQAVDDDRGVQTFFV